MYYLDEDKVECPREPHISSTPNLGTFQNPRGITLEEDPLAFLLHNRQDL